MDRSGGRNVHFYDANRPTEALGGLVLNNGPFSLRHGGGNTVQDDQSPLQRGDYYIHTPAFLTRTISANTGTRTPEFPNSVRARDRGCAITGKVAVGAEYGNWRGFECAHIFPLAYQDHWERKNFGRWITVPPLSGQPIDSVQNGILLRSDIQQGFDQYLVSINPDDGYKIVCFDMDGDGIAGRSLDPNLLAHPHRPVDQLFRWHFRQAVLANMKGAGEPVFEHDFPPGSDMAGQIRSGPKAAERMQFEMFTRLAGFEQTEYS